MRYSLKARKFVYYCPPHPMPLQSSQHTPPKSGVLQIGKRSEPQLGASQKVVMTGGEWRTLPGQKRRRVVMKVISGLKGK